MIYCSKSPDFEGNFEDREHKIALGKKKRKMSFFKPEHFWNGNLSAGLSSCLNYAIDGLWNQIRACPLTNKKMEGKIFLVEPMGAREHDFKFRWWYSVNSPLEMGLFCKFYSENMRGFSEEKWWNFKGQFHNFDGALIFNAYGFCYAAWLSSINNI